MTLLYPDVDLFRAWIAWKRSLVRRMYREHGRSSAEIRAPDG